MTKPIAVLPVFKTKQSPGDRLVSTVSHSAGWQRDLSPFLIGPCYLYRNYMSKNMENAWQFSKVYKEHLDEDGEPNDEWYKWAFKGWDDEHAHRYPMGRGAVPEYSYWRGKHLDYIEARKTIYGPLYAEAVQKTKGWAKLKDLYKTTLKRLVLLDYDAYDHEAMGMSLTDVLNNPKRKMGHAFVLAMLLTKDPALDEMKLRKKTADITGRK